MTYVNGVGPQVVPQNTQQKLPVNQPLGGKIIAPPPQQPQGPTIPNTPLAGLISPPKLPPQGPYIPAPIAGLINPPRLPRGPITQPPLAGLISPPTLPPKNPMTPLGGLIAPPKNPAQKPEMPPEKILEAIKDLLEAAKNNNQAA